MNIHSDYIGRRLDKFLRDNFSILQSKICILSKQKKLLINNKSVKFDYRIQKGDTLKILDEVVNNKIKSKNNRKKTNKDFQKDELPIGMVYKIKNAIIYEDENVLAINKPYGLSVQGGTGVKHSLEDFFHILCEKRLRIVHRIDKDTSGILLLAKNIETAIKLTEMFKQREVHKRYLAILNGIPLKKSGTIKTYIFQSKEDNIAYNARTMEERLNGKQAITKYRVLRENKKENLSLVEFFPLSGRKHQIRLHAQKIKCPIVGDDKYSFGNQKSKKLQLFAVAIDASPIVKLELTEKDFPTMIEV